MRCCCFTYGKKRLYAAVFFEDEDEDVGFLSSFERERERERENNVETFTQIASAFILDA